MPRAKPPPSPQDLAALRRAVEDLKDATNAAFHSRLTVDFLDVPGPKPSRSLVPALAEVEAVWISRLNDGKATLSASGVHEVYTRREATIRQAIEFGVQIGTLRPTVTTGHARTEEFVGSISQIPDAESVGRLSSAMQRLRADPTLRRSPKAVKLLKAAREIIEGDIAVNELAGIAAPLGSAYVANLERLEREAGSWQVQPNGIFNPCGAISWHAGCILRRGHASGHHWGIFRPHWVEIGDTKHDLQEFLRMIGVSSMSDAAAFLHPRVWRRHFAYARLHRLDLDQIRAAKDLVELAGWQGLIPEGPLGPMMSKALRRLGLSPASLG